jgi:membrane-associated HD superfamily phosphohydrolase
MLATFGFIVTGLCFAVFAYTFDTLVIDKFKLRLRSFSRAYYCLAVALFTWGVAASTNETEVLKQSVIIGDAFILLGTLSMFNLLLGKKNRQLLWLAALAAVALLYVRITQYPPDPYMHNGILVFNPQTQVALAIGLLFFLVWLPVSLKVARIVTHIIKQDGIYRTYAAIYVVSAISALLFLVSRRLITIIISFAVVGICFVMLIQSNLLIAKLQGKHHGR